MTAPENRWTEQDLERFIDDDLPAEARAALAEALRADGELRSRLGAIIDADCAIRDALVGQAAHPLGVGQLRWRLGLTRGIVAAAALLALLSGGWWALTHAPAFRPSPIADAQPAPVDAPSPAQTLAAARTQGLLIAVTHNERAPTPEPAQAIAEGTTARTLLKMLDEGDLDGALAMLRARPGGAEGSELWLAFGQRLSSGQAAQEVLLSLPAGRQVEVCRAWALQPSLRPVTFEWLARLGESEDASVRAAVRSLRAELAEHPELRSWLRSYASAPGPGPFTQ